MVCFGCRTTKSRSEHFRLNRKIREVERVLSFNGRIAIWREENKPTSGSSCKYFEKAEGDLECMSFCLFLNRRIICMF